ncbi:OTU-like cysteine protease [Medicago truncatula]|uniref:OTU-like cysteine protease n=1 Tax=Medicago truncatula TaxID=3880 RepID=A0A072U810_MEDTR|nr:OTU-like cysteine protease [Medicago truncatula]
MGDLTSCWDDIDKILKNQFGEIQGSFRRSITVMGYVSKAALGFIDDEFELSRRFGFAKEDCGCVQMATFGLPCACILAEKRKKKLPILLDEIHPHLRRLSVIGEEVYANFSVTEEWDAVQKRIKRAPYKMKLFIKYKLLELGFPEETMLKPPSRKVATKGAPKRVKSAPKTRSTGRIPSRWETIDAQNPNSQCSHANSNEPYLQIPYISQIPNLMRPYIEDIVNVKGDGNCGFRVVARHMRLNEDSHVLVRHALINELKNHKSDYFPFYATEKRYKEIFDGLHPPTSKNGDAPPAKWLTSPDMGPIMASCYNRAVVLLTFPKMGGACETYFPIQSAPPLNPHSNIMCFCLIPEHFLHAKLKENCSLPPPFNEWMTHKIGEAEQWLFQFLDRQTAFDELMSKEPMPPKKPTNEHNPINLDTPEKPKQEIEVMDEDEDYAISLV